MKTTTLCKSILFAFFLSAASFQVSAQELPKIFGRTVSSVNPQNGLIRCGSTEYEAYLQEKNPKRQTTEQFEEWLAKKMQEKQSNRTTNVTGVITIPVVVHVVHNGDAVGSNENISDAQVRSQITVLNQDYRRMINTPGYNDFTVGADMEIEFVLAQTAPDGSLTNGIDRYRGTRATWSEQEDINDILKPATSWDPEKYFNIWVVNFGTSQLLGYAQFPTASTLGGLDTVGGPADTDGVVIGYQYFGSQTLAPNGNYGGSNNPYRFGRTASHEVGHWLGLRHVNGDNESATSCNVNSVDSTKDYCPDTPATRYSNYGCSVVNTCPSSPGNDMIENYMDYSDDSCMSVFTQNQKNRMRTVMENAWYRFELLSSTVAQPPAAGTDQFTALNGLSLYPNPTQGELNITTTTLPDSYTIYNSIGQTMYSTNVSTADNLTVNTSSYSNGVYFVKVNAGKQSKTLKFVKN